MVLNSTRSAGKPSFIKKLGLDLLLAALMLFAFAYPLTGNTAHELIGFTLFALLLVHGKWNWRGFLTLIGGKCSGVRRITQTMNRLLLLTTLLMILSGLSNSTLLFSFFTIEFGLLTREFHTATAYWFLILMSIHLGVHWQIIMATARNRVAIFRPSRFRVFALRVIATLIAVYGVHASFERHLLLKLCAYYSFDYWEPGIFASEFFIQYIAIAGLTLRDATYQASKTG